MNTRIADFDLVTFRGLFIAHMNKHIQFEAKFAGSEIKWEGPGGVVINLYEDFVLLRVPISEPEDDAYQIVKEIPFVESNNNVEQKNGKWFSDFSVDFHGSPERLVERIGQTFKEEEI
jgi:hypothetical protein